jgi:hypothetical protein|nr:hypothetical protein [Kofleriaceae bacterium]
MRAVILAVAVGAINACSPYSPSLPAEPFLCGPQMPPCPDGFACVAQGSAMICQGAGGGDQPDGGGGSGFQCANDGDFEPNDTLAQAFATPVASERNTIKFGPLSICPVSDKDIFKVDITVAQQNFDVQVTYDNGDPLQLALLDASGATVASGSANGTANTLEAKVPNEPAGSVYAQVFGPNTPGAAGGENNYTITLTVSGP